MKYISYLLVIALWSSTLFSFGEHSFMTYRSQGFNLARMAAGWQKYDANNLSVAIEYSRSFDSQAINTYFFGCDQLIFSGSSSANRAKTDIMADYFGLPTDFKSSINFSPNIRNVITDFGGYWNMHSDGHGLNVRVDIPLVYSIWKLDACETVINPGTLDYPAGYMSNQLTEVDRLQKGALGVLSNCETFGDLIYPLQYGRIVPKQTAIKVADVLVAIGYNFIATDHSLLGINGQIVVPTGTRSQATTLFEPQIGNGHHWAFGAGLTSRYDFIGDQKSDWGVSASFDANLQHLFKTTQKRTYDLINGPGSRYMLLEDMISRVSITQGFSATFPSSDLLNNQYITRLLYVADATSLNSTIKIGIQADLLAKCALHYHDWNFDLGYSFWIRSREKLVSRDCLNHKFYGVKGDAQVYGFLNIGIELPLPLNATQSQATVNAPQGDGNTTDNFVNNNADNAALMYNVGFPLTQTTIASLTNTGVTSLEQVNGSNQAIILTDADINNCSGLSPRALSQKLFGSISYRWDQPRATCDIILGAESEFAGKTDCVKTAISQWGIWIKGTVNY